MRKITLIALCLAVVLNFNYGSVFSGTGFKVGVNISGLDFGYNDYQSFLGHEIGWLLTNNLVGFQAGFSYTIGLTKNISLQPELLYSERGMTADTEFLWETIGYSVNLRYIELPVLLKVVFFHKGRMRPGILFGPYGAYNISARKCVSVWDTSQSTELDNVNSFDYGILIGGFIEYKLGKGHFSLEFRFNYGFAQVMTIPDDYVPLYIEETAGNIRNFSGSLFFGFRL